MLALHRGGRTADALTAYQQARQRLADDIGIDPGAELQRLQLAILRNDRDLAPSSPAQSSARLRHGGETAYELPVPRQLPGDLSTFTGRNSEFARLLAAAGPDAPDGAAPAGSVVVAVDGMPGVGKTTLAVHAAHRLASRFTDGQLFVDLHGFTQGVAPIDPADALDQILRGMGVPGEQIPRVSTLAPRCSAVGWPTDGC